MALVGAGLILLQLAPVYAQESLDNLPVPRWATLASSEVNLRTGPGKRYPIDWVLKKKSLPVEIQQEFDHWRLIKEPAGATGWVHRSMLTGVRYAMVQKSEQVLFAQPDKETKTIALLQPGVVVRLKSCHAQWCAAQIQSHKGWLQKKGLWGIYDNEIFE